VAAANTARTAPIARAATVAIRPPSHAKPLRADPDAPQFVVNLSILSSCRAAERAFHRNISAQQA
jgi:hypothetical protein